MPLLDSSDLIIAAIPARADPRDVLISPHSTIDALPPHCVIGAGSLRRRCQLLAHRPDLRIQSIRGNIDTRVKKLRAGDFAATILAYAGLIRAGLFDPSLMHPLSLEEMLPAPGQGALALQCRKDDARTREVLAELDDPTSRAAVDAERSVVAALNCDCHSPIAVHARIEDQTLHLRAALGQRDGDPPVRSAGADSPLADSAAAIAAVVRQLST